MARRGLWDGLLASVGLVRSGEIPENNGFKGARTGRRSNFEAERQHINTAIRKGGALLRARSRFFCRENSLGISAKETWTAYVVGFGIIPLLQDVRPNIKKAWMKAYQAWSAQADYDGLSDFHGLTALACEEAFEAGEVFIRLIRSQTRPLQLQLFTSEQLPYNIISVPGLPEKHRIRLGVEFDAANRRVAYHFLRHHPGDATAPPGRQLDLIRVPADEVIHLFRPRQPGQIRGVPQTVGALIPGSKLDDYEDALLERAAASTRPIAAVERPESGEEPNGGSSVVAMATNNGDGSGQLDLEPGTLFDLNPGEKLHTIPPPDPGDNYREFSFRQSLRATSAMGVPNAETTGDLRNANYSSLRAGRLPFKRRVEQYQYLWLIPQALQKIWLAFVEDALLRGTVNLPRGAARTLAAYSHVRWMGPKWEYVDPKKDAEADILAVDNLLIARGDVIAERGDDPEETDQRIAEEQRREEKLNIKRRGKVAATATKPAADPDAPEDE